MARRRAQIDNDLFARTDPAEPGQAEPSIAQHSQAMPSQEPDYVRSVGVGLRTSEIEALDVHAEARGISRGALLKRLVAAFLAGDIAID